MNGIKARYGVRTIGLAIGVVALAGCSSSKLLPHESQVNSTTFQTYDQVETAYAAVIPGATRSPDLAKLGFDAATAPNVETLTYAGLADRFMVQGSSSDAHVPAQVEACIAAQDHCAGVIFHPRHFESHHVGNALLDLTGFKKQVVDSGWSAEVMLVLQDGIVIYKIMSGRPRIEGTHEEVQPLGPLQNLGSSVSGSGEHPKTP